MGGALVMSRDKGYGGRAEPAALMVRAQPRRQALAHYCIEDGAGGRGLQCGMIGPPCGSGVLPCNGHAWSLKSS